MFTLNREIGVRTSSVLFATILVAGGLVACDAGSGGTAGGDGQTLAMSQDSLIDWPVAKTWMQNRFYREVPICMHPTSVMGRADANQLVNYWAHLLNHTWTQATGITFTGWQACTTPNGPNYGQDDVINVHILDMDCAASTSMQGSESDGTSEILVMPCRNVVYDDMVMIHEFGHALGFDHEADRKDFPTITSKNCPWMGITKGTSTASNEYTLPDPFSMMNATYCHALIELSYEDIVGAQNAWGRPNYFADVTGDGADDAIVVNPDGAYVIANAGKRNSGGGHFTGSASNWGGFAGKLGTFFADVNGDRKADMIAVDTKGVAVSLSNGSSFAAYKYWTSSQFVGLRGTYFADIDGDGKADAIRATTTDFSGPTLGFEVRKSTGTSFGNPYNPNISLPEPMVGSRGWFADVTGPDSDGKSRADFIYYNTGGVWVNKNGPSGFKGGSLWLAQTGTWAGTNQVPALPVLFADINGDGKQDYIATSPSVVVGAPASEWAKVYYSNGAGFATTPSFQIQVVNGFEKGVFAAKLSTTSNVRNFVWATRQSVYAWNISSNQQWDLTGRAYYGLR